MRLPRSTYRLQLHAEFDFDAATDRDVTSVVVTPLIRRSRVSRKTWPTRGQSR